MSSTGNRRRGNLSRKRNKRSRVRGPGANGQALTMTQFSRVPLPARVPTIVPSSTIKTLSFQKSDNLTAMGANYVAYSFTPNGAYDVDPALGSTNTPGFSTWCGDLYNYFRVLSYSYIVELCNEEDFAIQVYVTNTNVSLTSTPASFPQYSMNPLCHTKMLGNRWGDDRVTFRKTVTVCDVVGTAVPLTADNYRGTSAANPQDLVWLGIGVQSIGSTLTALGIAYTLRLNMCIQFYDRIPQTQ